MEDLRLRLVVKRELRKRMRGVRNTLPASTVAARSREIARRLTALPCYTEARSVALFWPISGRNEVDLRELLDQARTSGKRVAFPATINDGAEVGMRFVDPGVQLEPGPLGFDEPPPTAPLADRVDLVVVPALAVDPRGHRIGYGRGYYDRLLTRMEPPNSVVVAYDFQLLIEVPVTEGDVAVGWVVTDRRSFRAGEDPGEAPAEVLGGEGEQVAVEAPPPEPGVKVIARPRRS